MFIENKAGAGGTLAHALAAQSPPDGYTYVMATNSTFAIAPHLYTCCLQENALVSVALVVERHGAGRTDRVGAPWKSSLRLRNPSPGNSISPRPGWCHEPSRDRTVHVDGGIRMSHIPYRAGSQAVQAVVAGDVQLAFVDVHVAQMLVAAGHVRVLGVTSPSRHPLMPDVPTVSETGLPGFEMAGAYRPTQETGGDYFDFIPRNGLVLRRPDRVWNPNAFLSFEVLAKDRDALDAHAKSESAKWGKVIRERGIKLTP